MSMQINVGHLMAQYASAKKNLFAMTISGVVIRRRNTMIDHRIQCNFQRQAPVTKRSVEDFTYGYPSFGV